MVAPTSSTIDSPRSVGQIAAIAGRSIGAIVCRQNLAIAIKAPVLPAETAQSASPDFTASIVCHIDDTRRPVRKAWLGLSLILTATSVLKTRDLAASFAWRSRTRRDRLLLTVEEKLNVRPALERDRGGGHDDGRPMIAAHRVQRYANVARHPWSDRPGRVARAAPGVGRDNSGFAAQGNARDSGLRRAPQAQNQPSGLVLKRLRAPSSSGRGPG